MTTSRLEEAAISAARSIRRHSFGERLREHHPQRRTESRFPSLTEFERTLSPAVRRTLATLLAGELTGIDLQLDDADREHIAYARDLHVALQALTDGAWGAIRPDVRMLFVDVDDVLPLPFQGIDAIPQLRMKHPPKFNAVPGSVGLATDDLAAWGGLWKSAHRTPAFQRALAAAKQVRADRHLYRMLLEHRSGLLSAFPAPAGRRLPEYARELEELARGAYNNVSSRIREPAVSLRMYNELVHACFVAVLGWVELTREPTAITLGHETPIRVVHAWRNQEIHLTVADPAAAFLPMLSPVLIDTGGPLDGLYLTTAGQYQFNGGSTLADLSAFRLAELEN